MINDKNGNKESDKIIRMPNRNRISDSEITSLFLGLCRIIKQQANDEAKQLFDSEVSKNFNLCKEVVKKNREIEMLKMINFQLKKKIDFYIAREFKTNVEN